MRTKPFTFKKTERVKVVTEYKGISVDLTVQEAADLAAYLTPAMTPDCRFIPLLEALQAFIGANGGVKSDLVHCDVVGGFTMVALKDKALKDKVPKARKGAK